MDPLSNHTIWLKFSRKSKQEALQDLEKEMQQGLNSPFKFSDLTEKDLLQYDALFIPGGHAPMQDLGTDTSLGRIILHFHQNNKPIASLCHGPIALLSTKTVSQGPWAFSGYRMTCYSDLEEKTNELMWGDKLKLKVEDALKENGAKVQNRLPMLPNLICDKELITGMKILGKFLKNRNI